MRFEETGFKGLKLKLKEAFLLGLTDFKFNAPIVVGIEVFLFEHSTLKGHSEEGHFAVRDESIMLFFSPIMLLSNSPNFCLLC